MPIQPLASGSRIGPASNPKMYRIKQVRHVDPQWIEYDAQDMGQGDMCVVKELAAESLCIRESDGVTIAVRDQDRLAWTDALKDFLSASAAAQIEADPITVAVRGRWAAAGTGYYSLELLPGLRTVPYENSVLAERTPTPARQSEGYTPSMLSAARLPTPPASLVQSMFAEPPPTREPATTEHARAAQVSTQSDLAERVAAIQDAARQADTSTAAGRAVDSAVGRVGGALAPVLRHRWARVALAMLLLSAAFSLVWVLVSGSV